MEKSDDYDVIVTDNNFAYASEEIERYGQFLKEAVTSYLEILRSILKEGSSNMEVRERLLLLIETMKDMPGELDSITKCISAQINEYVLEIDEADEYLY